MLATFPLIVLKGALSLGGVFRFRRYSVCGPANFSRSGKRSRNCAGISRVTPASTSTTTLTEISAFGADGRRSGIEYQRFKDARRDRGRRLCRARLRSQDWRRAMTCGSRSSTRTTITSSSRCCISWPPRSWAPDDVATSLRQSLRGHANVDVKMAEVTVADPRTRTVTTREGQSYQGDFLVLAAGSQANFFGTTGAEQNAFPLYSLQEAQRLALADPGRFRGRGPRSDAGGKGRAEFRDRRRRTDRYGDGRVRWPT